MNTTLHFSYTNEVNVMTTTETLSTDIDDWYPSDSSDMPSPYTRVVAIITLCIISLSGTVGNLMVFLSVWNEPKLRIIPSIFIINISIIGFLYSVLSIPLHIFHVMDIKNRLFTEGTMCTIFGYLDFVFLLATLGNSSAIAINRYVIITKPKTDYLKYYSINKLIVWILVLWLLPSAMAACGIPYYGYDFRVMTCTLISSREAIWFTVMVIGGPTVVTSIVISSFYYFIFKTVRNSRRRIQGAVVHQHTCSRANDDTMQVSSRACSSAGVNWAGPCKKYEASKNNESGTETQEEYPGKKAVTSKNHDEKLTPKDSDDDFYLTKITSSETKISTKTKQRYEITKTTLANVLKVPIITFHMERKSTVSTVHDDQMGESIQHIKKSDIKSKHREQSIEKRTNDEDDTIEIKTRQKVRNTKKNAIQEIRLTFHLLIVFAVFCVLYLPMSFAYLINYWKPVHQDVWLVVHILASSYFALAWILYGLLNGGFRRAYVKILKCEKIRSRLLM